MDEINKELDDIIQEQLKLPNVPTHDVVGDQTPVKERGWSYVTILLPQLFYIYCAFGSDRIKLNKASFEKLISNDEVEFLFKRQRLPIGFCNELRSVEHKVVST